MKRVLLAATLLVGNSYAEITYVDADVNSNTTLADGSALVEGTHYSTTNTADDLWQIRGFANGGTIISSNDTGNEDAVELRTTISGLTAGESYDVFTYFWGANGSARWRGRTGLAAGGGSLQGYNTNQFGGSSFSAMDWVERHDNSGSNTQSPFTFDASAIAIESNRSLYEVHHGAVVADANGEISIFVDDLANVGQLDRTWYDGVGYQLITIPEPSSAIFVAAGIGLAMLRRRRS